MSRAFHEEIEGLCDEGVIEDQLNYSVVCLLKVNDKMHPFTVKKRTVKDTNVEEASEINQSI